VKITSDARKMHLRVAFFKTFLGETPQNPAVFHTTGVLHQALPGKFVAPYYVTLDSYSDKL
jgi:hypothetical protein